MSNKIHEEKQPASRRDVLKWLALLPLPVLVKNATDLGGKNGMGFTSSNNVFMAQWASSFRESPITHLQNVKQSKLEPSKHVQTEYLNKEVVVVKGIPLSKTELAVAALYT